MNKLSVGPIILIFLGIIFLLNNLGVLPWDLWTSLWKFWPVILILVGTEILLGKKASFKTLLILAALIFVVPIFLSYNPFTNNPLTTEKFKIDESLGAATKAKINLDFPAFNLTIKSLDADSSFLVQGSIDYSQAAKKPELERTDIFGESDLSLSESAQGKLPFISNLKTSGTLSLSRLVPTQIFLKTGASTDNIDLSNLKVEYLEINSGASNINIKFASGFNQKVLIRTGASSITLNLPESLAAKVTVNSQVKSVNAPDRFEKKGNQYETKNLSQVPVKAQIDIQSAAGSVIIK